MMRPEVGQIIGDKFRLTRLIGEGGMGSVYEAIHEGLGTRVALKFLNANLANNAHLVARFLQEARVSASIRSPHVVFVSDVGQTAQGLPYLVMELLEGETLQSCMRRLHTLPIKTAVHYAIQILEGLEVAHEQRVVHRDLKPDNVFIVPTAQGPLLKLLDFGIAKLRGLADDSPRGLTRPGAMMGTPDYMAPEQAFGADSVDYRADLFAVGVILFEMIAGKRPVQAADPRAAAAMIVTGNVLRLVDVVPAAGQALSDVVARALSGDVQQRYQSASEMRKALEPFVSGQSSQFAEGQPGADLSHGFGSTEPISPEQAQVAVAAVAAASAASMVDPSPPTPTQPDIEPEQSLVSQWASSQFSVASDVAQQVRTGTVLGAQASIPFQHPQDEPFSSYDTPQLPGGMGAGPYAGMPSGQPAGAFSPAMGPMQGGVGVSVPPLYGAPPPRKQSKPVWPIVLALVAVFGVAVAGIGAVVFWSYRSRSARNLPEPIEFPSVATLTTTAETPAATDTTYTPPPTTTAYSPPAYTSTTTSKPTVTSQPSAPPTTTGSTPTGGRDGGTTSPPGIGFPDGGFTFPPLPSSLPTIALPSTLPTIPLPSGFPSVVFPGWPAPQNEKAPQ